MKVFLDCDRTLSQAMFRVVRALKAHAPYGVEIVREEAAADLVLLHVIGYPETVRAVERLAGRRQRYAVAQYCWRTTQEPTAEPWAAIWAGAEVVWSYYDLPAPDLLRTPLGVDPEAFPAQPAGPRDALAMTSGYVAAGESIGEVAAAAARLGGIVLHLGPDLGLGPHVVPHRAIPDAALARLYGRCRWVSGLRREEGFELPAAEGAACGCRPVLFDRPHYRAWYDGLATFVPEVEPEALVDVLAEVFAEAPAPPARAEVLARFDWDRITRAVWGRMLGRTEEAVA